MSQLETTPQVNQKLSRFRPWEYVINPIPELSKDSIYWKAYSNVHRPMGTDEDPDLDLFEREFWESYSCQKRKYSEIAYILYETHFKDRYIFGRPPNSRMMNHVWEITPRGLKLVTPLDFRKLVKALALEVKKTFRELEKKLGEANKRVRRYPKYENIRIEKNVTWDVLERLKAGLEPNSSNILHGYTFISRD